MSRSRDKGTAWETRVVNYLKTWWPHSERRAGHGANDRGDISGVIGVCIECKAEVRWQPHEWLKELDVEMVNAATQVGCVFVKTRGKTAADDGVILMRPDTFVHLLREAGY